MGKTCIFFIIFFLHDLNIYIYLLDEITWPFVRRKELSLRPQDIQSLHIMVTFLLQAANQSKQVLGN